MLPTLLDHERGRIALFRDGKLISIFDRVIDALSAGESQFHDGMFSVQEIKEPADLGVLVNDIHLWQGRQ